MRHLSAGQARRAVLGALGLARPRPAGRIDVRHFRRLYADVGVIQIDPINVLARAHHQIAMSRLGPYDRDAFDTYVWRSGEVYESWIHVDATAQVEIWPLLAHRRAQTLPWRAVRAAMDQRPEFLSQVLREVTDRGELSAAQLTDPGARLRSWGARSMGRAALDYHHLRGDLAISWRDASMTAYFDLAERVIPDRWRSAEVPDPDRAQALLLRRAVQAVGVGTVADLADHHRLSPRSAARLLAGLADRGEIEQVTVTGWRGPVYADPALVVPNQVDACTLLNPFDPVLWFRPRVARLFDLDYRIEIYVPAAERRYGYYVLPFLLGDRLVALVDLKLQRSARQLQVRAAHLLEGDPATVSEALAAELSQWACWLDATSMRVEEVGDLADHLRRRL